MNGSPRHTLLVGALLLLAGGTLQAAAHRDTFSATVDQWPYQAGAWATLAGGIVLSLAASRCPAGPRAAVTASVGSALVAALAFSQATVNPTLADVAPSVLDESPPTVMLVGSGLAILAFGIGWLSFGVSLLRRGGRAPAAMAVVVAAVISLAPMIPGPAVLGLALVWLATSNTMEVRPGAAPMRHASGVVRD